MIRPVDLARVRADHSPPAPGARRARPRRGKALALAAGLLLGCAAVQPARADGTFLQLDIAKDASGGVVAISRGRLNFGANLTTYQGGRSAGLSLTYSFPLGDFGTFKLGPALGRSFGNSADKTLQAGLQASWERYTPTSFGALYLLGQASSIDHGWFLLAQTTFGSSGFGLELSHGGSTTYHETALALTRRLGQGPFSLRAGYKFVARQVFVGLSYNTF